MLENPKKFKNSPNLLVIFVKITKFLEFSKKITIKNYSLFELWWRSRVARPSHDELPEASCRLRHLHARRLLKILFTNKLVLIFYI